VTVSLKSLFLIIIIIIIIIILCTIDTFVAGIEKSAELGSTAGGSFLHEPIRHLLLTAAPAGTFGADVVDDVGEAADISEVGLKTATERHKAVASLGDDDYFVARTSRSKLLQFTVFTRLYEPTRTRIRTGIRCY